MGQGEQGKRSIVTALTISAPSVVDKYECPFLLALTSLTAKVICPCQKYFRPPNKGNFIQNILMKMWQHEGKCGR